MARRLAGLFAWYARQRPALLADWLDGNADDLDGDLAWQPELWRALVASVPADPPHIRHGETDGPVAGKRQPACRPGYRCSGIPGWRAPMCELLNALATHPICTYGCRIPVKSCGRRSTGTHGAVPRYDDGSRHAARHPLLETLGRDMRELQRALPVDRVTDEYVCGAATKSDTLLGRLQSDIAANAVTAAGPQAGPGDRSVQVHSCHGPARQIDVLRECCSACWRTTRRWSPATSW